MRLIDADEVLKIVKHFGLSNPASPGRHSGIADIIYDRIAGLPIIEAAEPVRHGKWEVGYFRDRVCSCCLHPDNFIKDFPHDYCPNCGAKMDLEEEK